MTSSTKQPSLVMIATYGALVVACSIYLIDSSKVLGLAGLFSAEETISDPLFAVLVLGSVALVSGGWMTTSGKKIFRDIWRGCRSSRLFKTAFYGESKLVSRIVSLALLFPIFLLTLLVIHDLMTKTWPLNLSVLIVILALGTANWRAISSDSREEPGFLGKIAAEVLMPIAFGLTGVLLLQLAFNSFDLTVGPVRHIENAIGYASDKSGWLDFSPWSSICMTGGAIALGSLVPRWKVVSSFLSVKGAAHKIIAAITCLTSFTFFSQAPVRHFAKLDKVQIVAQRRAEAELQQSQSLAIQATGDALQNLTLDDRDYYRSMFEAVSSEVPYRYQRAFLSELVQQRINNVDMPGTLEQPELAPSEAPQILDNNQTKTHNVVRDQTIAGLKDMFSEFVGAFRPELKGIAGKFIEEFVSQASEKVFEEGIRPNAEEAFNREEARIKPWVTQTLSTDTDRSGMKEEEGFHLDMAALRKEIQAKELKWRGKEDGIDVGEEPVEEVTEPIEPVE